jgi:AcrR family transcriptional regulator
MVHENTPSLGFHSHHDYSEDMSDGGTRRGPYAKGVAKRQQILREALAAYAESDSAGPSLRTIAARVGLSERGLLHYFPSRDELLVSVLAERDAAERELLGDEPDAEKLAEVEARSARTPGLVRLFVEMAAGSADPANPAHAFFTARYRRVRGFTERVLRRTATRRGAELASEDAAFLARMLIAASDGLQIQWLLDPSIDLESDLRRLGEALGVAPSTTGTSTADM